MQNIELQVSGMSCGHCASHVTKTLKEFPGVSDAKVDLASGRAVVSGENLQAEALIAAVDEAGFEAKVKN